MENPTSEMFYQSIKKGKSKKELNTTCLVVKNEKKKKQVDPTEQRRCFVDYSYYEDLAVSKDYHYDNVFLNLFNARRSAAKCLNSEDILVLSEDDVEKSIDKLNTPRCSDVNTIPVQNILSQKN